MDGQPSVPRPPVPVSLLPRDLLVFGLDRSDPFSLPTVRGIPCCCRRYYKGNLTSA